jgi:beta-glucosidase
MWATFNEPWVIAILGYEIGIHAPGHRSQADAVRAAHHLLLAHGRSLPIIRANSPAADVGIVLNLGPQVPASNGPADIKAARLSDGTLNRWFLDPLAGFGYPNDVAAHYGDALDVVQPGDMEAMAAPIDFLGVNYYMRGIVRAADEPDNAPQTVFVGDEKTDMDWEVYPQGLSDMLLRLHTAYRFPALYVTENGAAYKDQVAEDGAIHDEERISYYRRHLLEAARAIALGVPLRGYFAWSLMDNFEWAYGLSKRFGLVYVDFDTQARILKDSAYWYGDVIASNEVS